MHLRPALLLLALASAPLPLGGCERQTAAPSETDATDRLTHDLLTKLRHGEHDAALALCNATLAGELGERDLAVLTRTLDWLGGVEELAIESEEALVDGVRRNYRVRFGQGEIDLAMTVVAGKIEGFELDENQWSGFVDQAAQAEAGQLRVAEFQFLDAENQPTDAPTDPAMIIYELAIEGLESQLREHHVTISKSVFDAAGNQVYMQKEDDEVRFSQAESGASGGRVSGNVAVPGPGDYELVLEIHDQVAATSLTYKMSFTIN